MQEIPGKPLASWREIDQAIWRRMAERARKKGVRAFRLNGDPRHWAVTSASQSGVAYEVTILDDELLCSCPGSAYYRYCKHRALVLAELGLLDPEFGVEAA